MEDPKVDFVNDCEVTLQKLRLGGDFMIKISNNNIKKQKSKKILIACIGQCVHVAGPKNKHLNPNWVAMFIKL